ncbi:hypothetical protein EDD85DRAFT_784869 [Armillaria nabsnona]|nr:hypothetical protein EDD85DRAFT_784869 [Armillaria nabsnona]
MSDTSEPPDDIEDTSFTVTSSSRATEAKRLHMEKFEKAAESVVKDYGKTVEVEGTPISAIFDVMVVLRHMIKNELRPSKAMSTKQLRTVTNMVGMLEAWMDMEEYKAAQNAMALANLMNDNFKMLQENSNTIKTAADTQCTNGEAVSEQLQELKQNLPDQAHSLILTMPMPSQKQSLLVDALL